MNFSIETKYPIQIFQENNLECSWNTIKVGWDLKRLEQNEVSNFAISFLESHPNLNNEYILELISEVKQNNVENILKKLFKSLKLDFPEHESPSWNKEWRKWRYCIMNEMVKHVPNTQDLLIKIEGLYADFGYPEDMKHLIYYMPTEEKIKLNYQDACITLVNKIKQFLQEEKVRILNNCNSLPRIISV